MKTDFFCFGEILWDCLPSGRHAGGAPFNVAAHLAQLGARVGLVSAVGTDALGAELLAVAREKGVDTTYVQQHRELPTGTVRAALDAAGNATYTIEQPVAWDEIPPSAALRAEFAQARAFVFGTLAARSGTNRAHVERLLTLRGPMKFFDVNLRPPFISLPLVLTYARQAHVVKLNDDEAALLDSFIRHGRAVPAVLQTPAEIAAACSTIARTTNAERICITRGAQGAALWESGHTYFASAPAITVRDTVGAGDAFMAGLVYGLTHGLPPEQALSTACRLGAYVASHAGATPEFPAELKQAAQAA